MFDGFTAVASAAACVLPLLLLQLQLICQRLTHVLMDSVYRIWIQYEAQVGVRFPPNRNLIYLCSEARLCELFVVRFRFSFVYFAACFLAFFSCYPAPKVCCKIELFMIEWLPKVFHYKIKNSLE